MKVNEKPLKYKLAMGLLMGPVTVGLIILMAGLHDIARWGGYAEALPLVVLFLLFVVGHFVLTAATRRRVPR